MKSMVKKVNLMVVMLMVFSFAFSANFGLYSSFTNTGTTSGGLRTDFGVVAGEPTVMDLSYANDGTNYTYWAAAYYGYLGVALSGGDTAGVNDAVSLMIALERPINDQVILGIAGPLVKYELQGSNTTSFLSSFDFYGILMF